MAVHPVLHFLRRIPGPDHVRATPDADLLARFVAARDEAAFTGLVQRHGPMVLGVCVRVLGDLPEAEDAFQATFLVLARRASALSRPELLGNWLYGVAYRTALKARATRLPGPEGPERVGGEVDPADAAAQRELRRVLDDELSRLPDRYRVPLVLHYLEGQTQEQVAQQLGCPRKTVTTRLARACEQLRGRLARRSLALSVGSLVAAFSQQASADFPARLLPATVQTVLRLAAGGSGLAPPLVVSLAEGVLQAMFLTKVKIALGCVLVLSTIAMGASMLTHPADMLAAPAPAQVAVARDHPNPGLTTKPDAEPPGKSELPPLAGLSEARVKTLLDAFPTGDRLSQLVKEQYEAARLETEARRMQFLAGQGTLDMLLGASRRMLQAELDLSGKREDHTAALKAYFERMKEIELINEQRFKVGQLPISDVVEARFNRIRAEIWLERFKTAGTLPADAPALPR